MSESSSTTGSVPADRTRTSSEPEKPVEKIRVEEALDAWDAWEKPAENASSESSGGNGNGSKEHSGTNGKNGTHTPTSTPAVPDSSKLPLDSEEQARKGTGFLSPMLAVSGIFKALPAAPKETENTTPAVESKAAEKSAESVVSDKIDMADLLSETQLGMTPVATKPITLAETQEMPPVIRVATPPALPTLDETQEAPKVALHTPAESAPIIIAPAEPKATTSEAAPIVIGSGAHKAVAETPEPPKATPAITNVVETAELKPVVVEAPKVEAIPESPKSEEPRIEVAGPPAPVVIDTPLPMPKNPPAEPVLTPAAVLTPAPALVPAAPLVPAPALVPAAALRAPESPKSQFQDPGAPLPPPLDETQAQPAIRIKADQQIVSVAEGPGVVEADAPKQESARVEPKSKARRKNVHVAMSEGGVVESEEPQDAVEEPEDALDAPVEPAPFKVETPAPTKDPLTATWHNKNVSLPTITPTTESAPVPENPRASNTRLGAAKRDAGPVIMYKSGEAGKTPSKILPSVGEAAPAGVPAPKVSKATFTAVGGPAVPPPVVPVAQEVPVLPQPAPPVHAAPQQQAPSAPLIAGPQAHTMPSLPPPDSPFGAPPPVQDRVALPPADSPFGGGSGAYISGVMEMPRSATQTLSGLGGLTGIFNAESFKRDYVRVEPLLKAEGLKKRFGKREVVTGVELEVGRGEIVGLLGRNGAGKTTSFRMIVGMLCPDAGRVSFDNVDITRHPMYKRALLGIGYLAQEASIFQKLTVEKNLLAVLELHEPNGKKRMERMDALIHDLGLEHVRKSKAATLSGGERRRLEIARTMSLDPKVVLFDEPFAGIDPIAVTEIQDILRALKKRNVGVLITDHNVRETLIITDRTYIMDEGKIWIHGSPREIVKNPEAKQRYLGHGFRLDF